jgi:4-hydroxybenzoate polyprenyltransferase
VSLNTLAIILSYFIMNILYTFWLKNVVLLDIMIIAMGFLLRVMAGATAISVEISSWIFLTTLFISLFIGFAKRRNEIIILDDESTHRPVLQNYTVEFLNSLIMVSVTLTIITYSLYTKDPDTISRFNTDNLIYTVPIVIYGIFRYLYLMYVKGEGGDPTDTVSKDPGVILSVLSYALSVVVIVLQGKGII